MSRTASQRVAWFVATAVAVAAACAIGCGYSFITPGAHLPAELRTVFVADIDDRSTDPELTDALERELRRIFRASGRFALAADSDRADAVLSVDVAGSLTRPVAFDDLDEVLDYETTMRVDAVLRSSEGEVLWEGLGIGATRAHAAVAGAVITSSSAFQSTERLTDEDLAMYDTVQLGEQRAKHARDRLVGDLAGNIYTLMAEGR